MTLRVKNEKAGRTIYCPECDDKLIVPDDSGVQSVEDEPLPKAKKVRQARIADEDDEPPRKRRRDDDDEDEDRPRPRKRKKRRAPVQESSGLSSQAPIAIGYLMMLGAVVWFVLGLMADRIFFYPPIMFVLGIISVGRGLMAK